MPLHRAGHAATFDRIILKFPAILRAFTSLRKVFRRFDTDHNGTIDHEELQACLEALGAHLPPDQVDALFQESNMTEEGDLDFKEFTLCLCIGSVLQMFPKMKAYDSVDLEASNASVADAAPASGPAGEDVQDGETEQPPLAERGARLIQALQWVLEAWVLFDADASGTLDKDEVLGMIREHGGSGRGANLLLSADRWEELDWDSDGSITIKEWLYAFMTWVGLDDVDTDDESDGELDGPLMLSSGHVPAGEVVAPGSGSGAAAAVAAAAGGLPSSSEAGPQEAAAAAAGQPEAASGQAAGGDDGMTHLDTEEPAGVTAAGAPAPPPRPSTTSRATPGPPSEQPAAGYNVRSAKASPRSTAYHGDAPLLRDSGDPSDRQIAGADDQAPEMPGQIPEA